SPRLNASSAASAVFGVASSWASPHSALPVRATAGSSIPGCDPAAGDVRALVIVRGGGAADPPARGAVAVRDGVTGRISVGVAVRDTAGDGVGVRPTVGCGVIVRGAAIAEHAPHATSV